MKLSFSTLSKFQGYPSSGGSKGRIFNGEVKTVITLSGKEVDLPTCKLEHKVESETEKEKREEIKGKREGKA